MYSILNVNNIGFIYERYYNDNHITIYTCIKLTLYHVHCNPLCTLNLYLMCQTYKKKKKANVSPGSRILRYSILEDSTKTLRWQQV